MIYICIPTHDEQQTVGVVLWKLRQVFAEYPRDYQLLVADDASTDKTPEVLEPYTRVLPLTVIRSETRLGYAATMEMLLREAVRRSEYPKRDVVVTLQADFSEEPDDLIALIKRMEAGADIAVGNKIYKDRETRTRRMSRALAGFFTRRHKWPEGVITPFDSYRAYRLDVVRRAMEEREGRRLLRYDGWAGHAELLRAVLPHARRVDVVDVLDRPDRLQRPRREKPFAYAMQVRTMLRDTEPANLVPVEALDTIAATASRSRERAAVTVAANGRTAPHRGNGGGRSDWDRNRGGRPERPAQRGGRGESSERGRPAEGDRSRGRGGERRPQEQRPRAAAEPRQERPPRPQQPRRPEQEPAAANTESRRQRRPPKPEPARAAEPAADIDPAAAAAAAELLEALTPLEGGGPARPKKRRRRRKKSGGAAGADQGSLELGADAGEGPDGDADSGPEGVEGSEDGENGEVGGTGERKRRRRGGRRGGRGRRKGPRPDGSTDEAGTESAGEPAHAAAPAPAPPSGPEPLTD